MKNLFLRVYRHKFLKVCIFPVFISNLDNVLWNILSSNSEEMLNIKKIDLVGPMQQKIYFFHLMYIFVRSASCFKLHKWTALILIECNVILNSQSSIWTFLQKTQVVVNSAIEVKVDLDDGTSQNMNDLGKILTSLLRRCSPSAEGCHNGDTGVNTCM